MSSSSGFTRASGLQLVAEQCLVQHVLHAQANARHLVVLIARTDAALGGTDVLLAELLLKGAIRSMWYGMMTCALPLILRFLVVMPSASNMSISSRTTLGLTTQPLPITDT